VIATNAGAARQRHEHAVSVTRHLAATRERVFACWTSAEHLAHWFAPAGFSIHSAQADPRPAIAHTHVFVLPARGDVVPQALIEAVAMGRPVITSTARGCRVAVREGANGMIVPAGDAHALAGAMARLLLRPDLIPSMSRASRELAESQFDARRINGMLLAALDI